MSILNNLSELGTRIVAAASALAISAVFMAAAIAPATQSLGTIA